VDPIAGDIVRDGTVHRPDPRCFRLLLYLAERPGQVVSIEELLNQVWSGVIVTPDSVYQAVTYLRRLLGDDPKSPTYIATVPRSGYRLIARVSASSDDRVTSSAMEAVSVPNSATRDAPSGSKGGRRRVTLLLSLSAGLCLAGALVFAFLAHGMGAGWLDGGITKRTVVRSIAVLPFLDLTSESMDQEYFADGMTEELIDKLSRLPGVMVPSPTSSFYFKGQRVPVSQIAKSLGVEYVLSGSVRQSEQKLRIAVRLVRANDGYVIWSETYDRASSDKLLVQDDIATQVARALKGAIG
jgi:TolB-like protein/DNA-binding winged helix-turn-helix (wHTH) protein